MEKTKKLFEQGQKVRTIFGKIEEVLSANEYMVKTYESARRGDHYHPTKVWPVK